MFKEEEPYYRERLERRKAIEKRKKEKRVCGAKCCTSLFCSPTTTGWDRLKKSGSGGRKLKPRNEQKRKGSNKRKQKKQKEQWYGHSASRSHSLAADNLCLTERSRKTPSETHGGRKGKEANAGGRRKVQPHASSAVEPLVMLVRARYADGKSMKNNRKRKRKRSGLPWQQLRLLSD